MFILWVTLKVKPEGREEFVNAITENAKLSVRDEEGCYRFDIVELGGGSNESNQLNHFAFYEVYRDREAFEKHQATPHFLAYKNISAGLVVPDNQTDQTGVSGQLLASFGKAVQPGLLGWAR